MKLIDTDIEYVEKVFSEFYDIGANIYGGVTRLGYTKVEDEMHEKYIEIAKELDMEFYIDEVGNTFVSNTKEQEYYLIGSHLDSVINGGRYDGVVGIFAGLLILKWIKDENLDIPLKVVAFRCEESSNFGKSTVGSGLITKQINKEDLLKLVSKNGRYMTDIFYSRGYNTNPKKIEGIKKYLELHIEQGRVLEENNKKVGIVTDIAAPRRFEISIYGEAEHSGATPMNIRNDALCASAELILEIEKVGREENIHKSVTTVGVINNLPNALNVISGEVNLGLDIRGIDKDSLDRIEKYILSKINEIQKNRNVKIFIQQTSRSEPVKLNKYINETLKKLCEVHQIEYMIMPSGAGHDAMTFAQICDTGLVFIPCNRGISHNKNEFSNIEDIISGAKLLYEYIKEDWNSDTNKKW